MSVKRYIATGTGMVVMRDGNCITYADYLKLEAERDALKAIVEEQRLRLRGLLEPAEEVTGKQGSTAVLTYIARLEAERDTLKADFDKVYWLSEETQKAYNELLFAVARKFPNETRHETALRYINQAENQESNSEAREVDDG